MTITIKSVPQNRIRADQAGDWWLFGDDIVVHTLETFSKDDQFRIAIHELVEAYLCRGGDSRKGFYESVTEEQVCAFDYQYEAERKEGKHKEKDEPGDDPRSPYREQHSAATHVERATCHVLNIPYDLNWPAPSPPEPVKAEDRPQMESHFAPPV